MMYIREISPSFVLNGLVILVSCEQELSLAFHRDLATCAALLTAISDHNFLHSVSSTAGGKGWWWKTSDFVTFVVVTVVLICRQPP